MQQFNTGRTQAYDQARTGSYQTGVQAGATRMNTAVQSTQAQIAKQLQESGWSLGQVNALMAGLPAAPGGQASNTSLLNAQLQNSLAQQQMQAQAANNLVGAGATILGSWLSDVNAKEDFTDPAPVIEEFLQSAEPSEYNYKPEYHSLPGAEGRHVSPMAQNLERSRHRPLHGGGDACRQGGGLRQVLWGSAWFAFASQQKAQHCDGTLNMALPWDPTSGAYVPPGPLANPVQSPLDPQNQANTLVAAAKDREARAEV